MTAKSLGVSTVLALREIPRKGEGVCSRKKPFWTLALREMGLRKTAVQTTLLLVLATSISFAKGTLLQSHDWLARQVHVLAAEVSMALDAAPMHSASQVVPVLPACFVHRYNVIHRCCGVESLAFADRLDHGCQHRVVATSTILPAALTAGALAYRKGGLCIAAKDRKISARVVSAGPGWIWGFYWRVTTSRATSESHTHPSGFQPRQGCSDR